MNNWTAEDYLMHHGIKGQKWGDRNGPPYPLGSDQKSAREKRRTHSRKIGETGNKFKLSDKQQRAIKIGAGVAAGCLVAYGAYKLSQTDAFNDLVSSGKTYVEQQIKGTDFPDIASGKETNLETVMNTNPEHHTENCLMSALAGHMRRQGKDVIAKNLDRKNRKPMHKAIKECFEGATVITSSEDRSLSKSIASSKESAAAVLKAKFGDNAEGVIGVNWSKEFDNSGHAFNWKITNGHVIFSDYQAGYTDADFETIWGSKAFDPRKYMCVARLDGTKVRRGLSKYVSGRS